MAGITRTAQGSSSNSVSKINKRNSQAMQPAKNRKITKPSERSNRVKTGSQRTKEMQGVDINRKGLKSNTIAVKNSISESGKGKGLKMFG